MLGTHTVARDSDLLVCALCWFKSSDSLHSLYFVLMQFNIKRLSSIDVEYLFCLAAVAVLSKLVVQVSP